MSKKKKLIPEFRFPEFVKDGEWEEKKLNEVCDINPSNTELPDEFVYIDLESVNSGKLLKRNIINLENAPSRAQRLLENGDIIYQTVRPYQKNNFFFDSSDKLNYVASTGYALLRSYQSKMYLYQYLHSDNFVNRVLSKCTGSNYPAINSSDLSRIKVEIPNPQEQQKIASCLSSLDEVIETQSQKLDLLKNHKKGLMQNLFPQEGEKLPKYRFKDFEKDGNWVSESFDKVYSFLVTNSFAREFLNYENGAVKNIHYGDIHTKFSTLFDMTKENVPFINPDVSINKIRQECYCREGDMIFADASEDMNDVGKSIEIINLNNEKLVSGLHTLLARQKERKLASGFGGYLFKSDWVRKQIQREGQGAKVLGISATRISNVIITYPQNPKEQLKIASCLSSLDTIITAQGEKIKQLRQHKKGLMQGLFPKSITN